MIGGLMRLGRTSGGVANDRANRSGLLLDGADDHLRASSATISGTADVTFEAWVYQIAFNAGHAGVWSISSTNDWQDGIVFGGLNSTADGRVNLEMVGNAIQPVGTMFTVGAWVHVSFTYDNSSGAYVIYKNGVSFDSGTTTSGKSFGNTREYLGARYYSASVRSFNNARIDEVRIWNVVRTAPQILANMTKHITSASGLVASYTAERLEVISGGAIIHNNQPDIGSSPSHRLADLSGSDKHTAFVAFPDNPWVKPPNLAW